MFIINFQMTGFKARISEVGWGCSSTNAIMAAPTEMLKFVTIVRWQQFNWVLWLASFRLAISRNRHSNQACSRGLEILERDLVRNESYSKAPKGGSWMSLRLCSFNLKATQKWIKHLLGKNFLRLPWRWWPSRGSCSSWGRRSLRWAPRWRWRCQGRTCCPGSWVAQVELELWVNESCPRGHGVMDSVGFWS